MTTIDELTTERELLKSQVEAGKYKSLADVILDQIIGRFIQRLVGGTEPVSFWYSGAVMTLITLAISALVSIIAGEFFSLVRSKAIWPTIWLAGMGFSAIVGLKTALDLLFTVLRESIIDSIGSSADLDDLRIWLVGAFNRKNELLCTLLATPIILIGGWLIIGDTIPFIGSILVMVLVFFQAGSVFYYVFPLSALSKRFIDYRFRLYASDPISSEVIACMSDLWNKVVFTAAVITAYLMLGLAVFDLLNYQATVLFVVWSWGILAVLFLMYHRHLAKIISKAKRRKLQEVQAKIMKLEAREQDPTKDTLEHIGKLMDYHDRIKGTRNSALDIRVGLGFLNSLLLPVLASLLGNIESVLELLFPGRFGG